LTDAETELEISQGRIAVRWVISGEQLTVDVDLPDGVEGVLRLPGQADRPLGAGHASVTVPIPEPAAASR
jgi:alpha-L-rhamnosidase